MTKPKSTGPKGSASAARSEELPAGVARVRNRLGMVITESLTFDMTSELTPDALALLKKTLNVGTPKDRFERLRKQVAACGLPQFQRELEYIEAKLVAQKYALSGRDDPAEHAMTALERAMMIADTDRYFQTLVKYNKSAKSRRDALAKNRAAASRFPPGSAEERRLVTRFGELRANGLSASNIPSRICFEDNGDKAHQMAIRRALMRLELLPAPRAKQKK